MNDYDYELQTNLCTPDEVCDLLGIGRSMVYKLLGSGELRGFRIGTRNWKIPMDQIDEYIIRKVKTTE